MSIQQASITGFPHPCRLDLQTSKPAIILIFVTRHDRPRIRQLALPYLVQVRVQSLCSFCVVVTRVDDILRVAVPTVVLLGPLDVLLALAD